MFNRFILLGELSEISILLFSTHLRVRLSINVNNQTITIQQTINHRWNKKQYDELCDMIHLFRPKIDGYVLKNGVEKIYTIKSNSNPSKLLISGNVNEWRGNIYFNGQYIRFEPNGHDFLSIEIDGQWIDNNRLLNVLNDSPVVFHFRESTNMANDGVYRINFTYNSGYNVCDNIVSTNKDGLIIESCKYISPPMEKEKIDKLMLEYEIIKD